MTRLPRWLVFIVTSALMIGRAQAGGFPVFDGSNFGQMVVAVKTLSDLLGRAEASYRALSGARGLGSVFNDPSLRQYLPAEWATIYDTAAAGGYAGVSGPLGSVRSAERLPGSVADAQSAIAARSRATAETDKAVGMRAFDGARARLGQIERLMGEINRTRDPKGIAELQARIAVEQAAIQNETTKLQLVAMLQRAEERLVEQQKADLAQRILSSSNTGMPPCCSSSLRTDARR